MEAWSGAGISINREIPNLTYGPSARQWHGLGRVAEGGEAVPTRGHDWLDYEK